jgi:hypothetical protein
MEYTACMFWSDVNGIPIDDVLSTLTFDLVAC